MNLIPCVDGTKHVTKEYCLHKCVERRYGCKGTGEVGVERVRG
jgi:hypothetical protein